MKKQRTISHVCIMCTENLKEVTLRDTDFLRRFMSGQNKILPRKKTGTCAKHQHILAREIKRGRELGVLGNRGQ